MCTLIHVYTCEPQNKFGLFLYYENNFNNTVMCNCPLSNQVQKKAYFLFYEKGKRDQESINRNDIRQSLTNLIFSGLWNWFDLVQRVNIIKKKPEG